MFIFSSNKIHSLQQFLNSLARFLIILAFGVWIGAILFLGIGVAPVNFDTAEKWQMDGVHPHLQEQVDSYRAIGGALTAKSIQRLNFLEFICIITAVLGFALFWLQRRNMNFWLILETVIFALILIIFSIYTFKIGDQLHSIREQTLLNFPDTADAAKSGVQQTFDRLHNRYTQLTGINLILLIMELLIISFRPTLKPIGRLRHAEENDGQTQGELNA